MTMESWSPHSVRLLVLLLCLVVNSNVSLAYSLKNCTFNFHRDAAPDVCLDCKNRNLVTVPDDIPKDTVILQLSDNQIENISREDFGDLSQLRILSLTSNLITHIDDGSFISLVSLKKLHMVDNQLSNLTSNVFEGLSNLTLLNLRDNEIKFIHPSAFQFLISLKTVILDNNELGMVSDIQTLFQLPHLQKISMKDNQLSIFQSKDLLLNKSSSLKVLDIEGNDLRRFSITTPIFPHLKTINMCRCGQNSRLKWDIPDQSLLRNITRLELSHAVAFENIPSVLQSFDSLRQLGLSFMEKWINKGLLRTVCRIQTLQSLDLSFNDVPDLSARLGGCSQLRELSLRNTRTSDLPKGSMGMLRRLRYLDLELNFFSKVPDDIKGLSSLRVLKLGFNQISKLTCDDFKNTSRLTRLILNNNRITKLDRCIFENLHHLKVLELGWNFIWNLGGAFKTGPRNLEFLNLKQNYIVRFEKGDFEGLGSVKQLDIVSEKIAGVDVGAFDGLHNMTSLNVSLPSYFDANFRALQQMEDLMISFPGLESSFQSQENKTVFNLTSLKRLDMFCPDDHTGYGIHVHIEMLQSAKLLEDFTAENIFLSAPTPDTFQFNSQLKKLTITESDMSDLSPELFKTIPNLQVLDLSGTNLKSLDFLSQAGLSALRYLHLKDNALTVINGTIIKSLPALTYLDLSNNPLTCDCSNAGFIQWVRSNRQTQVDGAHQYDCHYPQIKWGTKLLDFDVQSCWTDVGFLCYISSTSLVMLTLLTSFVFHFLRWQIVYAFQLFQAYLYDSKKKKKGAAHRYDAFISYNVNDEDWVYRELLPTLEEEQGWTLCLHHRDFQPGKPIIENITDAIYSSRKTICVISQSYLQSEWCSREIQMASFRLFDEKKDVLILLFLEEIPAHLMSPYYRMRKLVKKRTYLSWPQAEQHKGVFWQNVRRALETGDFNVDNENVLVGPEG